MEYLKVYRDHWELLRRMAIADASLLGQPSCGEGHDSATSLDPRTVAFSRLGALVAIGTTACGYQGPVDAAFAAGATTEEIIHTLVALAPIVGVAESDISSACARAGPGVRHRSGSGTPRDRMTAASDAWANSASGRLMRG